MKHQDVTRFHALRAPQITIKAYLKRIAKYSNCTEECFVLALIYIDRLIKKNENFLVNSLNIHRIMITSIMLAAKFFDDQYFNNAYFGKVGGVSCKEINLLEIEFVFMINFNLYVETDMYETYNLRLMSHAQPSENNGQQQRLQIAETEEPEPQSPSAAETSDVNAIATEPVEYTGAKANANVRASPHEAFAGTAQHVIRSKPRVSPTVVTRVRQRCTPPSPNFLQTSKRIHMKTY
jgi:hypothetical protein